jgi:hypothetical protein
MEYVVGKRHTEETSKSYEIEVSVVLFGMSAFGICLFQSVSLNSKYHYPYRTTVGNANAFKPRYSKNIL